jgi:nucleoside-diphosphate-sugar epimerase
LKVFVTGSSSGLAQALLPALCAQPWIAAVTGLDRRPPRFVHAQFTALKGDIRDASTATHLAGHAALIHLACVVLRGHTSEKEMFDVNVSGALKLFRAARAAGIGRMVHLSSAAVYGHGAQLAEDTPLAPTPGFLYASHKAHLEQLLASEFPECARLRPHVILGPHAQPLLKRLLHQPFYVHVKGSQPLLQCVHEDDVARAVLRALQTNARGPFNLATEDSFSFRDAIRGRCRIAIPLPLTFARRAAELARRAFGWGGEPAWVEGLTHTLTLDCRRALIELGWRSSRNAAQVIAQD